MRVRMYITLLALWVCAAAQDELQAKSSDFESRVNAAAGGVATLRAFPSVAHTNYTWRQGQHAIDGSAGRYRLTADGALHVAALSRGDSGVYTCVAEDALMTAERDIELQVTDPVELAAGIAGESYANVTGEIGRPLSIRCLAYGHPQPTIVWRRGRTGLLVNTDGKKYVAQGNLLFIKALDVESLGEYACQVYNGIASPAWWSVVVRAYRLGSSWPASPFLLAPRPELTDPAVTTPLPIVESTQTPLPTGESTLNLKTYPSASVIHYIQGGYAVLQCRDEGPLRAPVRWERESRPLKAGYVDVKGRLEISNVTISDSGVYICQAVGYQGTPGAQSRVTLTVENDYPTVSNASSTCQPHEATCDYARCIPVTAVCDGKFDCADKTDEEFCYVPQAPQANPDTKSEVTSEEGGMATLRCLFHSNPPPKITWKRFQITIDGNVGRYRLTSDGALEIVSLYRNDSGVYICVAENDLGSAQQEIKLRVNDPKDRAAGIAGEPSANMVGEIGRPLSIRCLAYGFPQPSIAWYRGPSGPMVPYDSGIYKAKGNVLLIRALDVDSLGEYTCQAYNGIPKPASWTVVVRAYRLDRSWPASPYLLTSGQAVVVTQRPVPTDPTVTRPLPTVEHSPEGDR